jgi:cell division protein FtsB
VFVLVAALAMGAYLYPLIRMDYASQREVQHLESQLQSLQERNSELREDVDRLKTPQGVEEAARESLGMVKPGENACVVVGPSEEPTVDVMPEAETVTMEEPEPWWRRVLDGLFGVGS